MQRLELEVFDEEHPLGAHDALNQRLGSVTLNDVQNNPLQPDLQYRGFTASPLLGTPQGLSVYQNGVRINEPLGDVLQWDVVPEFAIRDVQVMPGASPLFGLNSLGGSLVLDMKDGYRNQGHRVAALGGSFGRYQVSGEVGHAFEEWAAYGGVSLFGEQGFRDDSPSQAFNAFTDLRHRAPGRELGLSVTGAATALTGNGPAPIELLGEDRSALFTYPDRTDNGLLMVSADLDQDLGAHSSLQSTLYFRHEQRDTLNGDEGEFGLCPDGTDQVVCTEDGELVSSESGDPIVASTEYDGLMNTSATTSQGYGGSLQVTLDGDVLARENQLIVGTSYDGADVSFLQRAELGLLTTDRSVTGQGIYLGDDEYRTKVDSFRGTLGVYAVDTFTIVEALALQAGARFNWAHIELDDIDGNALDGSHDYLRVNPTVGVTYSPLKALTVFASYSEANRAPSAAELACADPDAPCRLPNAFVADPPLEQVVNRGVELGVRGTFGPTRRPALGYSLAGFGSRNLDDILFVAGSTVGTGYFRNAGTTQRVGLEAGLNGSSGPVSWYASYQLLRATFEDELALPGGAHPGAMGGDDDDDEGGTVDVEPGDRIPGLPAHSVKAGIAVRPVPRWEIALSTVAQSGQVLRGDEANLMDEVPGYAVLNARTSYDLFDELQLFIKAQNLLNSDYETFGVVADPSEVLPQYSDPRFLSPGPPFGIWAGLVIQGG